MFHEQIFSYFFHFFLSFVISYFSDLRFVCLPSDKRHSQKFKEMVLTNKKKAEREKMQSKCMLHAFKDFNIQKVLLSEKHFMKRKQTQRKQL